MNDEFILSNGVTLPIVKGFREKIKPNWRNAYRDFDNLNDDITPEKINTMKNDIRFANVLLSKSGISLQDKKIMDVGCLRGMQCFGAMEFGAREAVGIDIPEYYVNQSTNGKSVDASKVLENKRNKLRELHPHLDQSKISFRDLSVFEMDYENEFDIIFSWETFEHVMNPKEALKRIYKALKPGGVVYTHYNPFFCVSGGHSMCTLDYPFAHIILTDEDFKRYVKTKKPENCPQKYEELSYNFFTKNLNRMTQNDFKKYVDDVGFEVLDFMSLPEMDVLQMIDDSTLELAKTIHPTITLNDLLCSVVFFIGKK
tara:strand:+ start:358 stop:1296 length:939 start_codon:yes stop_codon:yes gene_type:complete